MMNEGCLTLLLCQEQQPLCWSSPQQAQEQEEDKLTKSQQEAEVLCKKECPLPPLLLFVTILLSSFKKRIHMSPVFPFLLWYPNNPKHIYYAQRGRNGALDVWLWCAGLYSYVVSSI